MNNQPNQDEELNGIILIYNKEVCEAKKLACQSCNLRDKEQEKAKEKLISSIKQWAKDCVGEDNPVNPNAGHCSQCGLAFNSFNNGYNTKALEIRQRIERG